MHIEGPTGLFVGKPVLGRISKRMTIQVRTGSKAGMESFAGIIFFSLSPDFSTTLHKSVRLDDGGF